MLDELLDKRYLKFEYPKDLVETISTNDKVIKKRQYRQDQEHPIFLFLLTVTVECSPYYTY